MVAPPFSSEYWEGCNVNKLKYGENHEITAFCSQNKWRGLKCYAIYTLPTAAAMHNRHFLGHNQSRSLRKILARLLIITSRRKVSVLGLVTKSMLKIFIWQQLGELGRAACSELREGTRMTITKGRAVRMVMRQGAGLGVSQAIITETNQVHITNYQSKQRLLWANNPLMTCRTNQTSGIHS